MNGTTAGLAHPAFGLCLRLTFIVRLKTIPRKMFHWMLPAIGCVSGMDHERRSASAANARYTSTSARSLSTVSFDAKFCNALSSSACA